MKKLIFLMIGLFLSEITLGQTSVGNNNPSGGAYLGWNGAQNLDFKTNSILRMQLTKTGTNNVDGYVINNNGFLGLSMDPNWFTHEQPYSLLHLNGEFNTPSGPVSQQFGYRDWMRPGITFTDNGDLMYVGPKRNSQDITDAVISWSDNAAQSSIGPDVLRFLFTDRGTGSTSYSTDPLNPYDYDGIEVARMTGDARMGVGPMWNNLYLPQRALDVIRRNDSQPQFRITYNRNTNVNFGTNADFQVSAQGNLHLLPQLNGDQKAVAIGFLDDPANLTDPSLGTFLDVGGLTRIRQLRDSVPSTLIIGYQVDDVNNGPADQFLGRIDFPNDNTQFLSGTGEWLPAGGDLDWNTDGTNVWTGTGTNGFPAGKVGIGIAGYSAGAKLDVYSYEHNANTGSIGIKAVVYSQNPANYVNWGRWTEVGGGVSANYGNYTLMNDGNTGVNIGNHLNIIANGSALNVGSQIAVGGASSGSTSQNYGILATSTSSFQNAALNNFGVYARACGATNNYAIYGETCTSSTGANWAGYFNGDVYTTGVYSSSDEGIKEDIQEIPNASEILNSLNPKSFYFQDNESLTLSSTK